MNTLPFDVWAHHIVQPFLDGKSLQALLGTAPESWTKQRKEFLWRLLCLRDYGVVPNDRTMEVGFWRLKKENWRRFTWTELVMSEPVVYDPSSVRTLVPEAPRPFRHRLDLREGEFCVTTADQIVYVCMGVHHCTRSLFRLHRCSIACSWAMVEPLGRPGASRKVSLMRDSDWQVVEPNNIQLLQAALLDVMAEPDRISALVLIHGADEAATFPFPQSMVEEAEEMLDEGLAVDVRIMVLFGNSFVVPPLKVRP